ncbi:hypothetical protein LX87_03160 [Larkinella arboricola]|uniref:Uncharacterized protein n=1 Tax=Larkinella arboricola TaxID=643671 RepID=A0A327X090_LARAB|nr:hypothetical protein LX87_03160 [Larkinella arboricola]
MQKPYLLLNLVNLSKNVSSSSGKLRLNFVCSTVSLNWDCKGSSLIYLTQALFQKNLLYFKILY